MPLLIETCHFLLTGSRASIANIIRLFAIFKLQRSKDALCTLKSHGLHFLFLPLMNLTVDAAPVFTWSTVEVSIGLVVAGVIELGPLMAKLGFQGFDYCSTFVRTGDDDTVQLNKILSMDKSTQYVYKISGPLR